MNKNYRDVRYESEDGLTLYARDYSDKKDALVVLCLHGLTRNARDFEGLCDVLPSRYRLIVPDQRGRGKSDYDSRVENYTPAVYVQDMLRLLGFLEVKSAVIIGTSMGGIMAMIMAALYPQMISAFVLNDVGPEISPVGLARLKKYVGQVIEVSSWSDAVNYVREINGSAFPYYGKDDWLRFARNVFDEDAQGVPTLAYDVNIARSLADAERTAPLDLWPMFDTIKEIPTLLIRGETSDILTRDCAEKMVAMCENISFVEVSNIGHAPMLDEPQAVQAIEVFLEKFEHTKG
ncbi:MAG: pimeloyl-ACP methyl ester carboxylesterase [Lentisphaeria bacterium]|jgi:pimeloyl-ACP methyl ester carboxylesterase